MGKRNITPHQYVSILGPYKGLATCAVCTRSLHMGNFAHVNNVYSPTCRLCERTDKWLTELQSEMRKCAGVREMLEHLYDEWDIIQDRIDRLDWVEIDTYPRFAAIEPPRPSITERTWMGYATQWLYGGR
jgi:hypothetical protein